MADGSSEHNVDRLGHCVGDSAGRFALASGREVTKINAHVDVARRPEPTRHLGSHSLANRFASAHPADSSAAPSTIAHVIRFNWKRPRRERTKETRMLLQDVFPNLASGPAWFWSIP